MPEARWSRNVMLLNMLLLYPLVCLGGYVLWEKARLVFWPYLFTWLGILTVGRYYVCRPCPYYGQNCPSFGFSHLARMFSKSETTGFDKRAARIDTLVIIAMLLLPLVVWVFGLFSEAVSFEKSEHVLMGCYVVLCAATGLAHDVTGCSQCDITECSMSHAAG